MIDYVEREFFPENWLDLEKKARRGALTEDDLPEAFAKLKRMFVRDAAVVDVKRTKRQIERTDDKLAKARKNLVLLEPENIPHAQEAIRELEEERRELASELRNRPTESDISQTVLSVLTKLFWVGSYRTEGISALKEILAEVDHIVVHTRIKGKGNGTRYIFERGEVHLNLVRGVKGRMNPDLTG